MRRLSPLTSSLAGISFALLVSITTSTAGAASTFLLQFGEHESEASARSQWETLQKAHADLLGDLNVRVAEIKTPDGKMVYRTQASALPNRDSAQEVCTELKEGDVECLVVETSMYMPEEVMTDDDVTMELPSEPEPMSDQAEEFEAMVAQNNDESSLAPEPALMKPMAEPVEEAPKPEKKSSSFKDALLPWLSLGGSKKEKEPEAPMAKYEPEMPAGVEEMKMEPAPVAEVEEAVVEEPTPAPAPVPVAKVEIEKPTPVTDKERATLVALSERFQDLVAKEEAEMEEMPKPERVENTEAELAARAPKNLMLPEAVSEQAPVAEVEALEPQLDMAEGAGEAEVEVAEAIRVPLSFGERAPVPVNKPVGYGGFPSQSLPNRTLWVQLSHFTSKEAAMGYWQDLRYQNPDMTRLLRVRVISPWQSRRYSAPRTSLRLGPFATQAEIGNICNIAQESDLRCSLVQDIGSSATANQPRSRVTPATQYHRRASMSRGYTTGSRPSGMYWVQLGAFDNVPAAKMRWDELQSVHSDALGRMQPQISYPTLSSSPQPTYHLRTGPFVNKVGAMNLCDTLKTRRLGCIVVQAR